MSHISSSRMPHAYAKPASNDQDRGVETAKNDRRSALASVSRGTWMLGALGFSAVTAVGAALYASLLPATPARKKPHKSTRKPAARRASAAA